MATSKTLSPTNVTISIPAMGDQPDASVFSNCIDKEADAINTLNSQLVNLPDVSYTSISGGNLSAFETSLTAALANMETGDVRVCPAIASYSQSLTNGGQAIAFLSKPSSTVWWCFLVISSGVKAGYYTNSAWTWL